MEEPRDINEARARRVIRQIRANVAFEHMVMAVLVSAAASAGVLLFLLFGETLLGGRALLSGVGRALFSATSFGFVAFVGGFFAVVCIGLPLHVTLEKMKLRKVWPYVVAGLVIELFAAAIVFRRMPLVTDFAAPDTLPLLLPGVIAAVIFGRRMKPVWEAAARAESEPKTFNLH